FWNDYLEKRRINLYISAWLPHEIPDIVIYHLCKLRKIPVLYFHTSSIRDNSFAEHDIEKSAEQIGKRYEELLREYVSVTDPMQIPLGEEFAARFEALSAPAGQKPPVESIKRLGYWDQVCKMLRASPASGLRFLFAYCTPSGLKRAMEGIRRARIIRARDAYYDAHAIDPDLSAKFVYLPLHFQPEASTVPMGGAFSDQNLVAALLNAHLPEDVLIYIKEHPRASSWLARTVPIYKELLAMKKVRFIRRSADTFALREKCMAVATVTGTAGFEGLFRGKPVFLFGSRFYQYARGVYRIRTVEDMKAAIQSVFIEAKKPSLVEARLYLKAMEETGIRGILNPWHMKVSRLTEEEHVKNNCEAILRELDLMFAS
ncbi:MAG: capsular polysaccharide biosynthesis protein, partial [Candidatus Peregrinibacteria bacterium Greene1014_49]